MNKILGHDCDEREIEEFRILRAIWANDIDLIYLEDADPRQYCAVIAEDDKAYAISVYDWWNKDLIRQRENIPADQEIPTIIKPIEEMENYECALCNEGQNAFFYDLDRNKLKQQLNKLLKENKPKTYQKK